MKTYMAKNEAPGKEWCMVDAEGQVLGRLAAQIAYRLRGKHKATYTPHIDMGDFVIVVNAEKIVVTGKKMTDKIYYKYSGYPGGLTETSAGKMLAEKPENLIRIAVQGMLPKTNLGRKMLKKLKVYSGNAHPHEAQCPHVLSV
jgi:large subunit ribosomal protein L13